MGNSSTQAFDVTTSSINLLAQEIRASDAVVVMGAGISFAAGMPLAGQLSPLVWHALDSNPIVLTQLCVELGVKVKAAKVVVADDQTKINQALAIIKSNEAAFKSFKRSFCDLDSSRTATPSKSHTALARLVHGGKVIEVVSFNWDSLLEYAFKYRFGFEINSQSVKLWKPHGDCRKPDLEWVLPYEDGSIPGVLQERLKALASVRPRILVIIGYSENDAVVAKKLIEPLANHWRVFRVNPSATGEGAIKLPAAEALEQLAEQLEATPDVPGWSIVTFENQRGIEAAIAGERLGPNDVEACPRLPHFDLALKQLSILHLVEIAGDSGSGKSITIWQLAHEFHRKGWQVLRLDASQKPNLMAVIEALKAQTWKTVAVADDSQIFPEELMERLRNIACKRLKVVLGTTDPKSERREAVRASALVAVEKLADYFRSQRATILPIIRQFDSRVGDGYMDIPIERCIDEAAKENTPWQFTYVLRGGTRRVRALLDTTHDFEQADLFLVLIAARQLASLDAGSSTHDLLSDSQTLGRSENWVRSSLELLSKQRAIINNGVVRCLHLQSAGSIIGASLAIRKDKDYRNIVSALQLTLRNTSLPLRGISWLLNSFLGEPDDTNILIPGVKSELISRCVDARTHLEIRDGCFVIARLLGRGDELLLSLILQYQELLCSWVIEADLTDAYAVGQVINNIFNDSHSKCAALLEGIDSKTIAEKIGSVPPTSGYVWGHFIGRLSVGGSETWRAAVASHLPRETIRRAVCALSPTECDQFSEYVRGIAGFDFEFALELLESAAPILAAAIGNNSIQAFRGLHDLSHWVLGEGLFLDMKPTKRQRAISKNIIAGVNPAEVVKGIVTCRFGEWENYARLLALVSRVHPAKKRAIVRAMDWNALDAIASNHLEKPGREFTILLESMVTDFKTGEPVAGWLLKHICEIKEIGSQIVLVSPQVALTVLNNGGTINLAMGHYSWFWNAVAIARINKLDKIAAKKVVESNVEHIAKGVAELSLCHGMSELLGLIAEVSDLLVKILNSVDIGRASERWPIALVDHRPDERKAARAALTWISERDKSELGRLAGRLLREVRFKKRSVT